MDRMQLGRAKIKLMSTRDTILNEIKSANGSTVESLAEAAGVSPVTVRHHLNSLQADGLLTTARVRRKVGRPYNVYSLSDKGHELFPKRYVRLSNRLIEGLKERFSPEIVAELFSGVVDDIVEDNRTQFENLPFEERLDFLVGLLADEGFLARWELVEEGQYRLIEYSCPYLSVGAKHDEICNFDTELILSVLETDVKKDSCMLNGGECCQFTVFSPKMAVAT